MATTEVTAAKFVVVVDVGGHGFAGKTFPEAMKNSRLLGWKKAKYNVYEVDAPNERTAETSYHSGKLLKKNQTVPGIPRTFKGALQYLKTYRSLRSGLLKPLGLSMEVLLKFGQVPDSQAEKMMDNLIKHLESKQSSASKETAMKTATASKFKPGDKVKYSAKFLKSAGMTSDRGRKGVITNDPTGMPAGRGFVSVKWNDEAASQPIQESALMKTSASFKGAVPGNLGDNTKPSTPESQQYAVDLLKQGGILPPDEKADDYPVLTAQVKREIIATLLRRKQPKLATWASRNLVTAGVSMQQVSQFRQEAASAGDMAAVKIADKALNGNKAALREVEQMIRAAEGSTRRPVRAAKNYASVVFMQNESDFNDFRGSGGKGQDGFFDSDEKEMLKYLEQWDYGDNYGEVVDPMQQKGSGDYVYKKGRYVMTYNPGLGYAGLYVKA
jgi:hypothetical protein